ncbi:MAG: potassium-transporting ATPase subunit KdpC [Sarcina sp.]
MKEYKEILIRATKLLLVMIIITGVIYPLVVTGLGQVFFNNKVNGSIIEKNGVKIGSELIGQNFDNPKYFFGRPSETSEYSYNTLGSKGSNIAIEGEDFKKTIDERIATLKKYDEGNNKTIPVDLITASASGLDPNISVDAANYQIDRVAKYRNLSREKISNLVKEYTEKESFGVLGIEKVNVLKLNLALDQLK